jgi:hypothetical protein
VRSHRWTNPLGDRIKLHCIALVHVVMNKQRDALPSLGRELFAALLMQSQLMALLIASVTLGVLPGIAFSPFY